MVHGTMPLMTLRHSSKHISFETILRALNLAKVKYAIGGGVAVTLHGFSRSTADLDLFVDFSKGNFKKFIRAIKPLGYRPRVPISMDSLAIVDQRNEWRQKKGAVVLTFLPTTGIAPEIDVFTDKALTSKILQHAHSSVLGPLRVKLVSINELIKMKKKANRPIDLQDIDMLSRIKRQKNHEI